MDRYLYKNLEKTSNRINQLKSLKNTKKKLEERIEYLANFKGKYINVVELLANTLEFLEEQEPKNFDVKQIVNGIKQISDKVNEELYDSSGSISNIDRDIRKMFNDMQEHHYQLHAILVHDGVALIGHYWAYIFDRKTKKWYKYNDITVEEVTEEAVLREAKGHSKTSAYCLIYLRIGEKSPILLQNSEIPNELHAEIEKDNRTSVETNNSSISFI